MRSSSERRRSARKKIIFLSTAFRLRISRRLGASPLNARYFCNDITQTMKFATVSTLRASSQPALVIDDRVHTLPYPDMQAVIAVGAERAASRASKDSLALDEVTFHSPIQPTTLRDAYAFETHVKTANRNRGQEVPENWYKFPVFYFSNPNNNYGHEEEIPYPSYTQALDYELEMAVVIGKPGMDIRPENAPDHIFGYTIFNDWSARV